MPKPIQLPFVDYESDKTESSESGSDTPSDLVRPIN